MSSHLEPNPPKGRGLAFPNSRASHARNYQGLNRRTFQLPMFRRVETGLEKLTVKEVTETVKDALRDIEAKDIQEATGGSIRAAENVRQGLNAMNLTNFVNACRAIPELRAVAMQMMGCEAETDPEFIRGLHHLINAHIRGA